jgi:hypothetical protein
MKFYNINKFALNYKIRFFGCDALWEEKEVGISQRLTSGSLSFAFQRAGGQNHT